MEKNLVRHKMGKTPIQIFEDLCLAFSDSVLSYETVYGLMLRFTEGTEDLKDFFKTKATNIYITHIYASSTLFARIDSF